MGRGMEATARAASSAARVRTVTGRLPLWVLIGAFLGILAGITFGERTAVLKPLGDVYTMMLLGVVYPYLLSSLIVGLGSLATGRAWRLLQASWGVYLFLWVAVFAAIFALAQAIPPAAPPVEIKPPHPISMLALLQTIVPDNLTHALSRNFVPAIIVFAVTFGLAVQSIPSKASFLETMEAIRLASLKVWAWVVYLAPIGVFALFASTAGAAGGGHSCRLCGAVPDRYRGPCVRRVSARAVGDRAGQGSRPCRRAPPRFRAGFGDDLGIIPATPDSKRCRAASRGRGARRRRGEGHHAGDNLALVRVHLARKLFRRTVHDLCVSTLSGDHACVPDGAARSHDLALRERISKHDTKRGDVHEPVARASRRYAAALRRGHDRDALWTGGTLGLCLCIRCDHCSVCLLPAHGVSPGEDDRGTAARRSAARGNGNRRSHFVGKPVPATQQRGDPRADLGSGACRRRRRVHQRHPGEPLAADRRPGNAR